MRESFREMEEDGTEVGEEREGDRLLVCPDICRSFGIVHSP